MTFWPYTPLKFIIYPDFTSRPDHPVNDRLVCWLSSVNLVIRKFWVCAETFAINFQWALDPTETKSPTYLQHWLTLTPHTPKNNSYSSMNTWRYDSFTVPVQETLVWDYTKLWRPLYHRFHFLLSVYTHTHFLSAMYDVEMRDLFWNFQLEGFYDGWCEYIIGQRG